MSISESSDGRTHKLLTGKYLVVYSAEPLFAGTVIWGDQLRREIKIGVYSGGDILMHIETGRLYQVREFMAFDVNKIDPEELTTMQRKLANKWRKEAWPERGHRKGIGSSRASRRLPHDI